MSTNILNDIKRLEPAFIELIHQRFGLIIHVNQAQELAKTITAACNKFNYQPREYLEQLKSCASNSSLLADLVTAITVGESYFFRDKNQMHLLEYKLLPQLIKRKSEDFTLKIWSAGCSSGEEIYTIAMLLDKLIPNLDIWDLYLLGTDINTAALQKAISGTYGQWSMRSIPEQCLQRYFLKNNRTYTLSPEIRDLVQFKYLNLCDNTYPSIINGIFEVDLILCRNVLIYFDNELVTKIMKKISACMTENAYLLLGASDPIVTIGTNLVFHHDGAIYFSLDSNDETKKDFE
ncbi:protein-glutamate O-methyltransferase CheR [Fluoribacter gormanii]|uniref:Chemotaxis protein methyltransferase n=1 Tax=Fluoribacter gormanii TaxID=464 RepID=A0A377GNB1_9GAMM|nr:CheR family methyltransferase [Fluoribacter gormanii]KTD04710.1 methyltransferase involved in chemotaxis (CheR domain) [Fluoribacter gormanii]MCW8445346.1 protein-glutamate O-methyltransferase CheR [Fluoribacter gormanii]MCW8470551.1 protein-glutamate O-methyltransferase CheR [Fluoribacter gormanii]SIR13817.1 chemotaxis protein methyltransferase CheR [Fluoribacter gormanii]STO26291.1 Chemotaxis protein methyltransferase [Fluoribacter gormanii]